MTNCELCGANCDNEMETIQTCSSCGHGKFHLVLTEKEKQDLRSILMFEKYSSDLSRSMKSAIYNLLERLK